MGGAARARASAPAGSGRGLPRHATARSNAPRQPPTCGGRDKDGVTQAAAADAGSGAAAGRGEDQHARARPLTNLIGPLSSVDLTRVALTRAGSRRWTMRLHATEFLRHLSGRPMTFLAEHGIRTLPPRDRNRQSIAAVIRPMVHRAGKFIFDSGVDADTDTTQAVKDTALAMIEDRRFHLPYPDDMDRGSV